MPSAGRTISAEPALAAAAAGGVAYRHEGSSSSALLVAATATPSPGRARLHHRSPESAADPGTARRADPAALRAGGRRMEVEAFVARTARSRGKCGSSESSREISPSAPSSGYAQCRPRCAAPAISHKDRVDMSWAPRAGRSISKAICSRPKSPCSAAAACSARGGDSQAPSAPAISLRLLPIP